MWADALPNLLIGLREGLEAGLVVSILLAAVHKVAVPHEDNPERTTTAISTAPIWLGVAAAVVLALSFGSVLTFYRSILATTAQEALGGALSVIAVVLVTAMIFWMRRAARTLSGELRAKVAGAVRISTSALALTAFLAVGREGLETSLFLFTTAQASGGTVAPLIGAAVGIAAAVVLCALLYRRAVRIRLGVFFNRTAGLLMVIAAGVLAYGLGDLQDAGVLPGHTWVAFDLTQQIDGSSWWASIITGVTELAPLMTWLQVVAYVAYLVVVFTLFVRSGHTTQAGPASGKPTGAAQPAASESEATQAVTAASASRATRRRVTASVVAALVVPPLAAAGLIVFAPAKATAADQQVRVSASGCAPGFSRARAGATSFTVINKSSHTMEINLVQAATQGIAGEIETLGPATRQNMSVDLESGNYFWRCLAEGAPTTVSPTVAVRGGAEPVHAAVAVRPVSVADLQPAATAYRSYVRPKLASMLEQVRAVRAEISGGDVATARRDWLGAQLTWERVGAAYGSFGALGDAIDGLPQALPRGVHDPGFTGLHRLEYGLWHGQSAATLTLVCSRLIADIETLSAKLPQVTIDPTDLPIRAHEILEDALRDHLNGMTDEGAGAAYPETYADVQGTRVVLGELAPLVNQRRPHLLATIRPQLSALSRALLATKAHGSWRSPASTPLAERQLVNARIGAVLENLSIVPDLLEVPAH